MVDVPILRVFVYRRDKETNEIDPVGFELDDIIECDVRLGIETIKDTFTIKIPNIFFDSDSFSWNNPIVKTVSANNTLQIGDFVEIRAYQDSADSTVSNNVLIYGEVVDFSYNNGETGPIITISGTNITENLLRGFALSTTKVSDVGNTVPEIIKTVVSRLNTSNLPVANRVFAATDTETHSFGNVSDITGENGNIASTKSNGSAFKEVTYTKTWQPVYKILEDLSAVEYTGDDDAGNYIFHIKLTPVSEVNIGNLDTNYINEIVFGPVSENVTNTLVRGEDYFTGKIEKNIDEVTNVLIVKPGTDPDGDGITTFVINESSLGEVGPKYGFWSKPEIGTLAKEQEKGAGIESGSTFSGFLPDTGQFPWEFTTIFDRGSEYPFTEDKSSPKSASDQDDYSDIVREEIKIRGQIEAQNIVDNLGEPRFTAVVELMTGSNNIGLGTLINVEDKTAGWDNTDLNPSYRLRLRDVKHNFNDEGWTTTLTLKEDEKVISDRINT